jgi:protein SCO1/2/putative membrane protein
MNLSDFYRRGTLIVACTVLASAVLSIAVTRNPTSPRAAQDLGDLGKPLGPFRLVERSGRTVTEADFADRVCIVSFIFTRCQLSCPRISSIMKSLQDKLERSSVLLGSLSVDPEHDTPQVLDEYSKRFGALPDRWWFLTGPRDLIYDLIQTKFELSVVPSPSSVPESSAESIAHSDRLALVERGRVTGLFDSKDPDALIALVSRARRSAAPAWVRTLPAVNASLNGLCACLLLLGWRHIRRSVATEKGPPLHRPGVRAHRLCMSLAVLTSAVFLACYLVYHYQAGSVSFRGSGASRLLYFTILISHTVLATFGVVPLVLLTLLRALRGDFARHRSLAATTFPIWLYVSVTGVVIYLMLYHLPASPPYFSQAA